MQPTVLYILSAAFSGSSLLNCLLDSQEGVRGLGEAVHLLRPETDAWCSHCCSPVSECRLRAGIVPEAFYESVFDFYEDARVVVNSSKTARLCFRETPLPPSEIRKRIILLSKAPHEFAYSYALHYECGFPQAYDEWVRHHEELYAQLSEALVYQGRVVNPSGPWPRIGTQDVFVLTYGQLAARPHSSLRRVCQFLGTPYCEDPMGRAWESDTCAIGGNTAVFSQRAGDAGFFDEGASYLDGKYAGRYRQIFVDRQWRQCEEFVDFSREWYVRNHWRVEKLARWLGHASSPNL